MSVNDLQKAAERIFHICSEHLDAVKEDPAQAKEKKENTPPFPVVGSKLLADLDTSILLRTAVGKKFGNTDEGHTHMLVTLNYCSVTLRFARPAAGVIKRMLVQRNVSLEKDTVEDSIGGRFHVLLDLEDDDDETMKTLSRETART